MLCVYFFHLSSSRGSALQAQQSSELGQQGYQSDQWTRSNLVDGICLRRGERQRKQREAPVNALETSCTHLLRSMQQHSFARQQGVLHVMQQSAALTSMGPTTTSTAQRAWGMQQIQEMLKRWRR